MNQETEWSDDPSARAQETEFASPSPVDLEAAEAAVAQEWKEGDVILDLYEVKGVLGEGGFGKVYRVHHTGWNIDLAVKTPRIDRLDEAGKENFRTEAETWVNLGLHPHTVSCYYVRDLGGVPRVFAEYVEGGSLSDWIRDKRLYEGGPDEALKRILDIAIQFAWGLHYAHEQGLVHQDVKPGNVMMTPAGVAKVTDFGLAQASANLLQGKRPADESGTVVVTGSGAMTPAYASPEQLSSRSLTKRTDIWSWGASVLEMFAGQLFWQSGEYVEESLNSYLENWSAGDGIPKMPEPVIEILRRCFKEGLDYRPKDAIQIATSLQGIYERVSGEAYTRSIPKAAKSVADSLNNRAVSLLDLGKVEEAETLWDEALTVEPRHAESIYNRGLCLWRGAKLTDLELLTQLEESKQTRPDDWRDDYLVAEIHLERGNCAKAIEILERLSMTVGDQKEVRDTLTKARELEPRSAKILHSFDGHADVVLSVWVNNDWTHALSTDATEALKLWDLNTGTCVRTLNKRVTRIIGNASVSMSDDARYAVSHHGGVTVEDDLAGSRHRTARERAIKVWDLNEGRVIHYIENRDELPSAEHSVSITPDGKYVCEGDDVWEVATGTPINHAKREISRSVRSGSSEKTGPDQKYRLSTPPPRLWDMQTGRCLMTFEWGGVDIWLSPDGKQALSGDERSKSLKLWQIPEYVYQASAALSGIVTSEKALTAAAEFEINLNAAREALGRGDAMAAARHVRLARAQPGYQRAKEAMEIWGQLYRLLRRTEFKGAWEFEFDSEERKNRILSEIIEHSSSSEKNLESLPFEIHIPHAKHRYSSDGQYIADKSFDNKEQDLPTGASCTTWELRDAETTRLLRRFAGHGSDVTQVLMTSDGRYAVTCSGGIVTDRNGNRTAKIGEISIKSWDVAIGHCRWTIGNLKSGVQLQCLSPDDRYVLLSNSEHRFSLWEIATGRCIRDFEEPTTLRPTDPDSRLGDEAGSKLLIRLLSSGFPAGGVLIFDWGYAARFIGLGCDHFAAVGKKRTEIWDVEAGRCVWSFDEPAPKVFSEDGMLAADDVNRRFWVLDWKLEDKPPADWDEGARPYLERFVSIHTAYDVEVPAGKAKISAEQLTAALRRGDRPSCTENEFQQFLSELACAGYGWLRPEGVRREMEKAGVRWSASSLIPRRKKITQPPGAQQNIKPSKARIRAEPGASKRAIVALVVGLFCLYFTSVLGIPAIVMGVMELQDIKLGRAAAKGKGLAITAIILGSLRLIYDIYSLYLFRFIGGR